MPERPHLLLIDDDHELAELLHDFLDSQGYDLTAVQRGDQGVGKVRFGGFDLVILDVMMPGLDGFEVLQRIRSFSATPVVMLTARGEDSDRIQGLEAGADDYLPKPFNPRELLARIDAVLRRSQGRSAASETLTVDDLAIDLGRRHAQCKGAELDLTTAEFDLLAALLRSPGRVVSRDQLFREVLDREPNPLDRSVDVHVSRLRRKLGPGADGEERIRSIRGVGYLYTPASPPSPSV